MLNKIEMEHKLEDLSSGVSNWKERAEERISNKSRLKQSARIAFRVLDEFKHQGMTQMELANRLGISPQAVSRWLKGKEFLTNETIIKLEQALDIKLLTVSE
jgi:ribosome-binding protein aMBF1 (putative translation factor)